MKNILFLLLLLPILALSQNEKGVSPINPLQSTNHQQQTYAVVVGISDYQDEDIPDLRFADRDAEAFANFLRSPAGGGLDGDHLKVLLNQDATQGNLVASLDWLIENSKEGDQAIIYFSGHGDVENKLRNNLGFLLPWDSPARAYMAGAYPIYFLQNVIETISLDKKAKVVVITDACRSGKLAGSGINGTQLTSANLAQLAASEIKILSCQADEVSIEGEQWGGGRGAFSFNLVDALYGLADADDDLLVTLKEVGRYLEDHVSAEVAPVSQNPKVIGSPGERLATVNPEILADIRSGKTSQMQMLSPVASRGMEDDVLAAADSNVVRMYFAFQKALKDKQFLFAEKGRPENDYADFYYKKLVAEQSLQRLHSTMTRNYAAALQDDAQQAMNEWMKTSQDLALDAEAGEKKTRLPVRVFTEKARAFPACLERAADLLGKAHYMYATLQARKHFFEGYLLANSDKNPNKELGDKALAAFRQALEWQPELPQAYWQMIDVYGYNLLQPDSAEVVAQKAIALSPSWVLPYAYLGNLLSGRYRLFDRAKPYLEKGMQLDSNSTQVLNCLGLYYNYLKEYGEAEEMYKKAIQLDSIIPAVYNNLGNVYRKTRRIVEAENMYKKAIQLDSTNIEGYNNLGNIYTKTGRIVEAENALKKAILLDSINPFAYSNLGIIYVNTGRYDEAEKLYIKAIQLDSTEVKFYLNLANTYSGTRRYDDAEKLYKKVIQLDSTYAIPYFNLGNVYLHTGRYDEAEKLYIKAIQLDSTFILPCSNSLGSVYLETRRYDDAENLYKKAIQLDSTNWMPYANLGGMYQTLQRWEASETMTLKAIKFGPPIWELRVMLGNAYTHLPGKMDAAKKELDKVVEMSPDLPGTYICLAQWHLKNNQPEQAWQYFEQGLEKGLGNGQLKMEDLQEDPDFAGMREEARWGELMQKYSPGQSKD